jgi:hypothetical protein
MTVPKSAASEPDAPAKKRRESYPSQARRAQMLLDTARRTVGSPGLVCLPSTGAAPSPHTEAWPTQRSRREIRNHWTSGLVSELVATHAAAPAQCWRRGTGEAESPPFGMAFAIPDGSVGRNRFEGTREEGRTKS